MVKPCKTSEISSKSDEKPRLSTSSSTLPLASDLPTHTPHTPTPPPHGHHGRGGARRRLPSLQGLGLSERRVAVLRDVRQATLHLLQLARELLELQGLGLELIFLGKQTKDLQYLNSTPI